MDAAGIRRAVLFAFVSVSSAALVAARAPHRVEGLVLFISYVQGRGAAGRPDPIVGRDQRMARSLAAWGETIEHHWGDDARWISPPPASGVASGCGARGPCSSARRRARR
jgi:hypothetical protein